VITVNIEILLSLVDTLDSDSKSDTVILEQETEEGITVRDTLNRLSVKYQRFVEVVFDVKAQKQTDRVNIFLNGRNLELMNGLATRLSDGDTLTFIAPIVGG
jgi:molybdopterin converting factor small subunit